MIHEYALEPSVLSLWASNDRDYFEFFREYGLGTPRIFSSFPKKQASKLRSYLLKNCPADSQSLQGRRYTEMVTKLVETVVLREMPEQQTGEWNELARFENERFPFGVVLSSRSINTERNITPDNMYAQGSVWNHPQQLNIQRTFEGFSTAVSDLIRLATKQVVVIDAYGWTREAIVLTQFLINSITRNRVNPSVPTIKLYYKSNQKSPESEYVKQEIIRGIDANLSDIKLDVFALEEVAGSDVFHNRCILTEHGGIITGHGIGISGEEAHTDEAILMKPEIYQKKWRQFVEETSFRVVSSF